MITRKVVGALSLVSLLGSCKDMGDEVKRVLTASTYIVSLSPGGTANITITGGTPPYSISQEPDPSLATASLANLPNGDGQLAITAASSITTGETTQVKVKDSGDDDDFDFPSSGESEIVILVTVSVSAPVSFSGQVQPIFTNGCVNQGCHPGGSAPFPLQSGQSHSALVGVTSTTGTCAGALQRVRPFNADSSSLIRRLEGTSCGVQMPFGFPALPQSEVNLIRDWINQGAINN